MATHRGKDGGRRQPPFFVLQAAPRHAIVERQESPRAPQRGGLTSYRPHVTSANRPFPRISLCGVKFRLARETSQLFSGNARSPHRSGGAPSWVLLATPPFSHNTHSAFFFTYGHSFFQWSPAPRILHPFSGQFRLSLPLGLESSSLLGFPLLLPLSQW